MHGKKTACRAFRDTLNHGRRFHMAEKVGDPGEYGKFRKIVTKKNG